MLLDIKERYSFKDDLKPDKKKWIDMEKKASFI